MEKILSFCEVTGKAVKAYEGTRKYVQTGDIVNNKIASFENVEFKNKPSRANQNVNIGDILFAKMKDTIKVIIIDESNDNNIYSTGFFVVTPKQNVKSKYLYWLFNSNEFNDNKNKNCKGATQKALNLENFSKLEIKKLPLIHEQEKIINQLDLVQRIIEIKKEQLEGLDELIKSQFTERFENINFKECNLKDVCVKITDGTHKTPIYQENGVTFISAKNVVKERLDYNDVKYITEKEYNVIQKRCSIEKGDIFLTKSGSLGTPVVFNNDFKVGIFESLAVIKYDRNKINGKFLCEQLKSFEIQKQFKSGTKGISIKHLHLNVIGNISIILPPIELQNQFAEIVKQIDKQKFEIQKSLEETEKLIESLMNKYFE